LDKVANWLDYHMTIDHTAT